MASGVVNNVGSGIQAPRSVANNAIPLTGPNAYEVSSGYPSMYNGATYPYASSMYSMSGYSPMMSFSPMTPRFGGYPGSDPEIMRFMAEAQNWTSKTFQPLATVMNSMSSIGAMLQTTYYSLQASVQSLVYVSHSISSLGSQFSGVLGIISLKRAFQWIQRFIYYVLGLVGVIPRMESVWKEAVPSTLGSKAGNGDGGSGTPWGIPVLLMSAFFVNFVFRRALRMAREVSTPEWAKASGKNLQGVVTQDFAGFPNEGCLGLKAGAKVRIAPSEFQRKDLLDQGWLLAAVVDDTDGVTGVDSSLRIGLVPRSLVGKPSRQRRSVIARDSGELSSD